MKKLLFLLLLLAGVSLKPYAQLNMYDDLNFGTYYNININNNNAGPWGPAFGTPSYTSPSNIYMWHLKDYQNNGPHGEGVFRRLNIPENGDYTLIVGVDKFISPGGDDRFTVLLSNDPLPPDNPNCGDGCPIPLFFGSRILYQYDYLQGDLNSARIVLNFSTHAGESYKYLVFYPEQLNEENANTELKLSCIRGYGCTDADLVFCNTIPGAENFGEYISIGSAFCSQTNTVIKPPLTTNMLASKRIEINPKTDITGEYAKPFTMEIKPCPYVAGGPAYGLASSSIGWNPDPCAPPPVIPKPTSVIDVNNLDNDVIVFPNPVRDILTIQSKSGSRNISATLYNVDGKIIRTFKLTSDNETVSLEGCTPGIYLLKITDGLNVITKKIQKMK